MVDSNEPLINFNQSTDDDDDDDDDDHPHPPSVFPYREIFDKQRRANF